MLVVLLPLFATATCDFLLLLRVPGSAANCSKVPRAIWLSTCRTAVLVNASFVHPSSKWIGELRLPETAVQGSACDLDIHALNSLLVDVSNEERVRLGTQ